MHPKFDINKVRTMSQYPETERLLKVMSDQQLNARNFAEQIGIQPATMSNLANGRNRPSLEVLQKVLNTFRMISSDWLILGVGPMYRQKSASEATQQLLFDVPPSDMHAGYTSPEDVQVDATSNLVAANHGVGSSPSANSSLSMPQNGIVSTQPNHANHAAGPRQIDHIVVFYTDGTYAEL